jgi:hypothetical protein
MSTSRPFAYNTGSTISGTIQYGNIAVGVEPTLDYVGGYGGVRWWNGPDEDLGYIICGPVPDNTQPTPNSGETASIEFWRSTSLTDESFIEISEYVTGQNFTTGLEASDYLLAHGYWTSYLYIPPTPTPTPTPTLTQTLTLTPTLTSTPTITPTPTTTPQTEFHFRLVLINEPCGLNIPIPSTTGFTITHNAITYDASILTGCTALYCSVGSNVQGTTGTTYTFVLDILDPNYQIAASSGLAFGYYFDTMEYVLDNFIGYSSGIYEWEATYNVYLNSILQYTQSGTTIGFYEYLVSLPPCPPLYLINADDNSFYVEPIPVTPTPTPTNTLTPTTTPTPTLTPTI